jgi:autotransporter-associated beta strand protein
VLANNQILDSSAVSIFVDGRLLVDNPGGEIIGPLTLQQGQIQTVSNNVLTLNGDVTVNASPGTSFINGHVSLGSGTRTFDCNGQLSVVADVAGTGGITKLGSFDLILQASNSFSGLVTISNGHVRVSHPRSLGTTAAGTIFSGTGTLELENNILVAGEALTLTGAGGVDGHVYSSGLVTNVWAGDLILNSTADIEVNGGSTLVLSNAISGSGGVNKSGSGVLRYTGGSTNSYTGTTTVAIGTLQLSKAIGINAITGQLVVGDGAGSDTVQLTVGHQIPNTTPVTVNTGGLLDLNSLQEIIGSLAGGGDVALGAPSAVLTCGANNSSTLFSGAITGGGAFTKTGNGVLTLSGTNTFTGLTTIQQGTLRVNGALLQSPLTMQNSAILAGTGVVNQVVSSGPGILAPGVGSPGLLTCSNLSMTAGGNSLNLELNGTTPGSGHDQLNVRGTNNLAGCLLNVILNFTPALSNQFVIINNDGAEAITGTFSGRPEGTVFVVGGELFRISYVGGDGNDVVLTDVGKNVVPRPVLTIQPLGTNAVKLLWPATFTDFVVQTNSNLATGNWNFSNQPQFIEGTNRVWTNVFTTPQMFFRLIQD